MGGQGDWIIRLKDLLVNLCILVWKMAVVGVCYVPNFRGIVLVGSLVSLFLGRVCEK